MTESPTIYDYLLLSLRKKDVVATINWDPLLVQALEGSLKEVPLSNYYGVFKHDAGNTLMGVKLTGPFYMELYGDPSKLNIQKIINALLLP